MSQGETLWNASLTYNNSDDIAVFRKALSGNNSFSLSNYADFVAGFSGDDFISVSAEMTTWTEAVEMMC